MPIYTLLVPVSFEINVEVPVDVTADSQDAAIENLINRQDIEREIIGDALDFVDDTISLRDYATIDLYNITIEDEFEDDAIDDGEDSDWLEEDENDEDADSEYPFDEEDDKIAESIRGRLEAWRKQ